MKKRDKYFSICSSAYIFLFLVFENFKSTSYPWILFCIPALFMWPVAVCFPRRFKQMSFACMMAVTVSAYYIILNIFLPSGFPWSFFIVFALMWYPASIKFARHPFALSIFGFVWTVMFFSLLNALTTSSAIWAVYPIFGVLWWPLSIYFFKEKSNK